jgi:hypothetical protein
VSLPPLYVVYDHPRDYPTLFVCRVWHGEICSPHPFAFADTLEEMHQKLPPGLYPMGREKGDDPVICEVWI